MTAPAQTDPAPATTEPATGPATGDPAATPPGQPPAQPSGDETPWADPAKAQAEIERLRRENASARTKAKENAANDARAALAQEVGRALGLIKDDEPVDPAKLTEQLTASQTDAKQARVELAVYRATALPDVTADPVALMDSVTFRAKVAALDPSDTAAITAAIGEAVAANPRLARSQAGPARMQPNPAQGSSAAPPLGMHERIAAAEKAGDMRTALRLKGALAIQNSKA